MKRLISKHLLVILGLFIILSCNEEKEVEFTLHNSNDFSIKDEFVSLELNKLEEELDIEKIAVFDNDVEIPSQLIDSNNDGTSDYLNFVIDIESNEEKEIELEEVSEKKTYPNRAHAEISVKRDYTLVEGIYKGGRFESVKNSNTPPGHIDHNNYYKFEGPGWESDLVGYRFYLDWRNATDIFGKKVKEMVLPNVGYTKDVGGNDSYHEMADWGMDVFKVGNSLGIGSIAAFHNGEVVKVSETDSISCTIKEDGPIAAKVITKYYGWKVGDEILNLESNISINAGSRLTKHSAQYFGNEVQLCTGLVKHDNTKYLSSDSDSKAIWKYIALWGKQSLAGDDLGIVLFYKNLPTVKLTEDDLNYIVTLEAESNRVEYYFGAMWSGESDEIIDIENFKNYIDETAKKLNNPITVNIN